MENCQRCLKNKPSFQCMECSSFNILCTRCDKIIHNMPSKQNHRRKLINQNLKDENLSPNNKNLINTEFNQSHISNIQVENDMINQNNRNDIQDIDQKINNLNDSKNNNILIPNLDIKKEDKKINQIATFNSNLLIKENYSKEYVNEIKKVFRKEKELLEYKNKTLQFSLDKIKLEFTDQINNITKELEDIQNTNILNISTIKENYEKQITELNTSHGEEISENKNNINKLENELNQLKEIYNKEIKEKNNEINELKNENERINQELNNKNEELIKIKNSFEIITKQYENEFSEEKNKIINGYELKIAEIVKNVENTKNNLVNLIEQREFDMKNILDEKNSEIFKLNEINKKIKEELESHKMNLVNIKNNKENLYKENQKLKNEIHKLDCDTQLQTNEIMRIQQENQTLYEENNKLKIELNKLDNIIYNNN